MKGIRLYIIIFILLSFTGCNRKAKPMRTDTPTSGVASIVCDNCFAPIIDEEIDVFQKLNVNAKVNPVYTNEVDAMNLLLKDSIRLVIAARNLTSAEYNYLKSKKLRPRSQKISVDGIAVIVNKQNKNAFISLSTLKKIFSGEITDWKIFNTRSNLGEIRIVFDNPNSSTVRYIRDSICGGRPFGQNVKSQKTNQAVIDFVSRTPNAMGIIDVNWVLDKKDSTNLSLIDKVKVMSVSKSDNADADNSYLPYAAYMVLHEYPLCRDIYIITSDVFGGLQSGIIDFIAGNQGQRIILKFGLVPATRPMRLVSVKNDF